jgi:hypothetical protein
VVKLGVKKVERLIIWDGGSTIQTGPYINNTMVCTFFERKIYCRSNLKLVVQWRKLVPTKGGHEILGFETPIE